MQTYRVMARVYSPLFGRYDEFTYAIEYDARAALDWLPIIRQAWPASYVRAI